MTTSDFKQGLAILKKYYIKNRVDDCYDVTIDYRERLMISGIDVKKVSKEDLKLLDDLGFEPDEGSDHRFAIYI